MCESVNQLDSMVHWLYLHFFFADEGIGIERDFRPKESGLLKIHKG